ncbi:MAG: 3-hydroxyacyl-CoA dehydrogenase family protein [Chlamydiales bacterium]|nr:3-hydroxyacyl-CoA dehydrogenase family protein [Chlamydiales bacterium]
MLDTLLQHVAVIGAAGKMGRGISLLLLEEMARLEAETTGAIGQGKFRLVLIDTDEDALDNLRQYLKPNILKWAERHINALRVSFKDNPKLVDNADIVRAFVDGAMNMIHPSIDVKRAIGSSLVFEAVIEDLHIKANLFKELEKGHKETSTFYFTNTSSIPIQLLEEHAGLKHQVIGFHFYNPPPVQPLVELIVDESNSDLKALAVEMGRRLNKTLVPSNDVAGFIGNGHFLREISYACEQVAELSAQFGEEAAICIVDAVTHHFLLRPMGIFQLVDYVGIDVAKRIGSMMSHNIKGLQLHLDLIDRMVAAGITGGQRGDGSQKDGFFRYLEGFPEAVYSLKQKDYIPLPDIGALIGPLPEGHAPWKKLLKDPLKQSKLYAYFHNLFSESSPGNLLAQKFLRQSRQFAQDLVTTGVAANNEDVNLILENGFAHLYGPINSYF